MMPMTQRRQTPTVPLFGHDYPLVLPSLRDARLHVAVVLLTLQALGQTVLGFRLSVAQILVSLAVGAGIEFVVAFFKDRAILWPASGLLTGNSTAFILRVPGTVHGDWWSLHGIWIFIGVVAVSMVSKYLVRWKGRHIFNPSNLGLVLTFAVLGPTYTEPLDLWWAPLDGWMILTYAILIVGGLLIAWELRLLALELGFLLGFATFNAVALYLVPDHCMVASWHAMPMCGPDLWQVLVISPEVLLFAFFMIADPRTVPDGRLARGVFGVLVALIAVLLIGPTTIEFWTKTAILGSLVVACALRFALVRLLEPIEAGGGARNALRGMGWRLPVAYVVAVACMACVPVSADLSTHGPDPAAGRSDGTGAYVPLQVGKAESFGANLTTAAAAALPPSTGTAPAPASARVWVLPRLPAVSVPSNVSDFDNSVTPEAAARMGHDAVLDLVIEAEARRAHDTELAGLGATDDGLKINLTQIAGDVAAGRIVRTSYKIEKLSLKLYLPKFNTQASRLVGVVVEGTVTTSNLDSHGNLLSATTAPYARAWGLGGPSNGGQQLIINDYTDLTPV